MKFSQSLLLVPLAPYRTVLTIVTRTPYREQPIFCQSKRRNNAIMPGIVHIGYTAAGEGAEYKFDMDYYLNSHMKLVTKLWESFGLQSWTISDHREHKNSPYAVVATLVWEDKDSFTKASQSERNKTIMGDIPNYTDLKPAVFGGVVAGEWSKK
jgi:uncharacterized protein (TIGR02118 family)